MAVKLYRKTVLTGGTSAALDGIDGNGLNDGDIAWVYATDGFYHYSLDADSGESESSPTYIVPDDNPGSKVWVLQPSIIGGEFYAGKWKIALDGDDLVTYYYDSGWVEHSRLEPPE